MRDETRARIVAYAIAEYPRECCGYVLAIGHHERVFRCHNASAEPEKHFRITPDEYAIADALGRIIGVYHSHPNRRPDPSQADRAACERMGVPWHIYAHPRGDWARVEPEGWKPPLEGREWAHGVLDCYTLVRDYYARELGITIPDFHREDNWWLAGANLYVEQYPEAGFVRVQGEPQEHDLLLMQLRSPVPNHGAVYVGDGLILHHVANRLSERTVYGGFWQKVTTHVLRHQAVMEAAGVA